MSDPVKEAVERLKKIAAPVFVRPTGQMLARSSRVNTADLRLALSELSRLSRLVEEAGEDGWRDISTAPKDGTEIIGFRPDQGVFVFRWAWMEEFVPKDQNGDPTEDYDETFSDWWHDVWGWMEGELQPTHWRPLPSPPRASLTHKAIRGGGE